MKLLKPIIFSFVFLLGVVGCQGGASVSSPTTLQGTEGGIAPDPAGESEVVVLSRVPEQFATPLPGNASLAGTILSTRNNLPLIQLPIQLAEVIRSGEGGNFLLDTAHSPTAYTDVNGRFVFTDIAAGEYVMVVGNAEVNRYEIVTKEDGRPQVFAATADQVTELDPVYIGLEWFSAESIPAPSDGYPAPVNSYP